MGLKKLYPIVQEYGIKPEQVLANTFKFDHEGNIIVLMRRWVVNQGKVLKIKSLNLVGDIFMIGDGYTDYERLQERFLNFMLLPKGRSTNR
jgi:D-3-phosphoglycerate dehydrogenase